MAKMVLLLASKYTQTTEYFTIISLQLVYFLRVNERFAANQCNNIRGILYELFKKCTCFGTYEE